MVQNPRTLRSFLRNTKGVAALELAIWAPVMSLVLFGGVEITRYTIATKRIESVASTIGQMLTVNSVGTVNYVDLQFYNDSAMVLFPLVLSDAKQQNKSWSNDIAITMSSVTFTASPANCTTTCTYVPKVAWSAGTTRRSCTTPPTSASNTAASSVKTLPADVFGPTSLIVVDVSFTFRPTIAPKFMNAITINRSYFVTPRYVPTITYTVSTGDNGIATVCS
jgi:Flp pilus assembly protein TadG